MAINVARYRAENETYWGVVGDDAVTDLGSWASTRDFMREGAAKARAGADGKQRALADVELLSPVTQDRQFICQAINYFTHMRESGIDPAGSPFNIFFRKASSCIAPADTDIRVPAAVEFLDYEVEIGLVLASDVDGPVSVTAENLHEFVGALVLVNDISARDIQLPEMQFYKGKSYRTFGPTGPWLALVDRDDLARFDKLHLRLTVNGETRQDSLADDMIHRPAPTLTELSALQDWQAGDLVATGTPGGCALQSPAAPLRMIAQLVSPLRRQALLRKVAAGNPKRLKQGDRIEAKIATDDGAIDLGCQRNLVIAG
jgi:2,4-diketo-3-deoxy-L-fuconate hydrolase